MRHFKSGKLGLSRQERIDSGICVQCNNPARQGYRHCFDCAKLVADKATQKRNKRIAEGFCPCGAIPTEGRVHCQKCLTYNNRINKDRIAKGLCARCEDRAEPGFKTCPKCRMEQQAYSAANKPTRASRFFMNAANQVRSTRGGRRRGGGDVTALGLMRLWHKQRGVCALTGCRLTRENAEVDHILPHSRGGSNDMFNLQWTKKDPNRAKQGMTDEEFIQMCGQVMRYAAIKATK